MKIITVILTPVMNMHLKATLNANSPLTLEKVKHLVYAKYQQTLHAHFGPSIPVHAKPVDLVLRGRGVVIDSEGKLDNLQANTINFEAYFSDVPHDKSIDPHSSALEKFHSEF